MLCQKIVRLFGKLHLGTGVLEGYLSGPRVYHVHPVNGLIRVEEFVHPGNTDPRPRWND